MNKNKFYCVFFYLLLSTFCVIQNSSAREIVEPDRQSGNQFGKTDFDRMADHEIRENIQSLQTLMIKLYKRNPRLCPACGVKVEVGLTICPKCRFDFAKAAGA